LPVAAEVKGVLEAGARSMVFPSPDRAIRALGHLADYSEFRRACDRLLL
jgi:acyl-CoA synthetase (NDP forming)